MLLYGAIITLAGAILGVLFPVIGLLAVASMLAIAAFLGGLSALSFAAATDSNLACQIGARLAIGGSLGILVVGLGDLLIASAVVAAAVGVAIDATHTVIDALDVINLDAACEDFGA